jgi:lipopolysaccharide/colanic/teichoic acid biosynthesis glycosyltransferase
LTKSTVLANSPPKKRLRLIAWTVIGLFATPGLALFTLNSAALLSRWSIAPSFWALGGVTLVAHTVFSLVLLEWGLARRPGDKWAYRSAFLLSAGWALWLGFSHGRTGSLVLTGVLGAFLGAVIGSSLHSGLWEDNMPPSREISRTVLQIHQAVIGPLAPVPFGKRLFDIVLSLAGLLLFAPLWLLTLFAIWFEDPGPLFFVKNSVGRGGFNFHQFKLRTMQRDAERVTGPVLAAEEDDRALRAGRLLRKTALDEWPQLFNILRGEMSFVGPRPQRTVLVFEYLHTMPEFAERHRVLPGLAGLAQVAGHYYITPRQKLRYDRVYARHAGLGFDLKLILLAFLLVFYWRWLPGWHGRIPRRWLH